MILTRYVFGPIWALLVVVFGLNCSVVDRSKNDHYLQAKTERIRLPKLGMSDPHLRFINGKFWLFTGYDIDSDTSRWVMPEWRIYSSEDMVGWQLESVVSPRQNYMDDSSTSCWAGDAATRHGKTYFYFSNHNVNTGVMIANTPEGPYSDALDKPLLHEELTEGKEFDPTLFIDDDPSKSPYIIFGYKQRGGYFIAKLNEDMVSLAEAPKKLVLMHDFDKPVDKNYLHKRGNLYYLSAGGFYYTSKDVYGPYHYQGVVGTGHGLGPFSHGSFLNHQEQWFHVWTRYLDRSHNKYRESMITYAHYTDDGKLISDTHYLDLHKAWGVGRYNAHWPLLEAEWFYQGQSIKKAFTPELSNGFGVSFEKDGSSITFQRVENLSEVNVLTLGFLGLPNKMTEKSFIVRDSENRFLSHCKKSKRIASRGRFEMSCDLSGLRRQTITIHANFKTHPKSEEKVVLDWLKFQ